MMTPAVCATEMFSEPYHTILPAKNETRNQETVTSGPGITHPAWEGSSFQSVEACNSQFKATPRPRECGVTLQTIPSSTPFQQEVKRIVREDF